MELRPDLSSDQLILNGEIAAPEKTARVSHFLYHIRQKAGISERAEIVSENNFSTGAGLASSASAFASLAQAGSRAAGLNLSATQLSELARLGSWSAARSIFGGFVEMNWGEKPDGFDSIAVQLADEHFWDLRLFIAVISEEEKKTGSTEEMTLTAQTSPFYHTWIERQPEDLTEMRLAIINRNFEKLGELAEYNCLKMHATMLSSRPGLIYWNSTTVTVMHAIRQLRQKGTAVYFTIDAGPQVKAICQPEDVSIVQETLEQIDVGMQVMETGLGSGVELIEVKKWPSLAARLENSFC